MGHEWKDYEPLPRPNNSATADQCREMGIATGDTVIGREDYSCGGFHVAKLTLLWAGNEIAVWQYKSKTNLRPNWRDHGEVGNFTLECRQWYKIPHGADEL